MFTRLQEKWGVSTRQFWIIFIIFGLTGTTTAVITRYITAFLGMDANTWWLWKLLLRIGMLIIGYQIILLSYAALLGQWKFFWKYERKLLGKLGVWSGVPSARDGVTPGNQLQTPDSSLQTSHPRLQTKKIAIFASGAGSNAEKIIAHLKHHSAIEVALVVSNRPEAGVLAIAAANRIPTLIIEKENFFRGDAYIPKLKEYGIGFIVLAGFLWKIPAALIAAFPNRIINIHPALLPKYGGKGMYGAKVHEAVIAAGEKESGITVHYVNEVYDDGEHLFQAHCPIHETDTPETLAQKIHALEHAHFPEVVEKWVAGA